MSKLIQISLFAMTVLLSNTVFAQFENGCLGLFPGDTSDPAACQAYYDALSGLGSGYSDNYYVAPVEPVQPAPTYTAPQVTAPQPVASEGSGSSGPAPAPISGVAGNNSRIEQPVAPVNVPTVQISVPEFSAQQPTVPFNPPNLGTPVINLPTLPAPQTAAVSNVQDNVVNGQYEPVFTYSRSSGPSMPSGSIGIGSVGRGTLSPLSANLLSYDPWAGMDQSAFQTPAFACAMGVAVEGYCGGAGAYLAPELDLPPSSIVGSSTSATGAIDFSNPGQTTADMIPEDWWKDKLGPTTSLEEAPVVDSICGGTCGARAEVMNNRLTGQQIDPILGSAENPYGYGTMDLVNKYGNGTAFTSADETMQFMAQAKPGTSFFVSAWDGSVEGHVLNAQVRADGTVILRDPSFPGQYSTSSLEEVFHPSLNGTPTRYLVVNGSPSSATTVAASTDVTAARGVAEGSATAARGTLAGAAAEGAVLTVVGAASTGVGTAIYDHIDSNNGVIATTDAVYSTAENIMNNYCYVYSGVSCGDVGRDMAYVTGAAANQISTYAPAVYAALPLEQQLELQGLGLAAQGVGYAIGAISDGAYAATDYALNNLGDFGSWLGIGLYNVTHP